MLWIRAAHQECRKHKSWMKRWIKATVPLTTEHGTAGVQQKEGRNPSACSEVGKSWGNDEVQYCDGTRKVTPGTNLLSRDRPINTEFPLTFTKGRSRTKFGREKAQLYMQPSSANMTLHYSYNYTFYVPQEKIHDSFPKWGNWTKGDLVSSR